jgi:molybdate transport repressor ModE-like protein
LISVKHLQILAAVIRLGSVTAAARELNVSQPTASKAIRRLEDVAGTHLFERFEGRLMPTQEALILAREADHLIDEWGTYQRLITNISQRTGDRLRVAAAPTYAATLIPRAIMEMTQAYPDVHIQCDILTQSEITDAADSGKVDVGIVHYTDAKPMAVAMPVCRVPIVCILPTGHPLVKKDVLEITDLNDWPLVGYRRDLPFARMIGQQLGVESVPPNVTIEVNHTSLIRDLVRLGGGIAMVDMFTLLFDPPVGIVIRPITPAIEVTMAIVHARNRPLSRTSKAFVECIKDLLPTSSVGDAVIEVF